MFFIELERKQKQISKQVDRETEAYQKQVQTLTYQPDTAVLNLVIQKPKGDNKKENKKPKLNVRLKSDVALGDKRKERDEENGELPDSKRMKHEEGVEIKSIGNNHNKRSEDDEDSGSGLGALLAYGSDDE